VRFKVVGEKLIILAPGTGEWKDHLTLSDEAKSMVLGGMGLLISGSGSDAKFYIRYPANGGRLFVIEGNPATAKEVESLPTR